MATVATFHVLRWKSAAGAVQALALDRVRYRNVDGLEFLRVLGTGRASSTGPGYESGRTALFAVFNDESCADTFIERVGRRSGLREAWHVKLRGAGGHGAWRGREIPREMNGAAAAPRAPIAMITRADVRLKSWRAFSRDARVVDQELHQSDGLLAVVGIGEAPILRLGTFSLWRDEEALTSFARRQPQHTRVIARTRREGWYGEEMFARFAPYGSTGTWDGRDPLRQ